jgi:hypothetical protein
MDNDKTFVLRPMRLVALLDAAFRLYRRNFWTFVGVVALLQIPVSLLGVVPNLMIVDSLGVMESGDMPLSYFLGLGLSYVVAFLQYFLIAGVATLALTYALSAAYFGNKIGILEAYRKTRPLVLRFLLVLFLVGALAVGLSFWTLIPCIGWLSGPAILLTLMLAVLPFCAPIIVLENQPDVFAVISRSWDLVRRRFWWLIGLVGVLYLLNLVLTGPASLFLASSSAFAELFSDSMSAADVLLIATIFQVLAGLFATILYLPIQVSVIVLAYFDLRVRSEGIDLFLNAIEDDQPFDLRQFAEMPRVKHSNQLVTGTEIGYFVIITLAVILLYIVLVGGLCFSVLALTI